MGSHGSNQTSGLKYLSKKKPTYLIYFLNFLIFTYAAAFYVLFSGSLR